MQVVVHGHVLADSQDALLADGIRYFPAEAVAWHHLRPSGRRSVCPYKGVAEYYTADVGVQLCRDAAWVYRWTWPWSDRLRHRVAFCPDLVVESAS
ncbi:DUF427 domain-containing protein [Catellatospora aurea]|uniref:DUF427 domain-containing protein n=1 Tax=Catellatospora aurea TaxID=1337874 RepID=A0ABW2H3V2_9ACTN